MRVLLGSISFFLLLINQVGIASEFSLKPTPPGKWQCRAYDVNHRMWSTIRKNQQDALIMAHRACRANSDRPETCRVEPTYCTEGRAGGQHTNSITCKVRDNLGRTWTWRGPDACDHALEECFFWQSQQTYQLSGRGICYVVYL